MNKVFYIILVSLFSLTIISCAKEDDSSSSSSSDVSSNGSGSTDNSNSGSGAIATADKKATTTALVIEEVTAVTTPTIDTTPNYTFSSTKAGTITYGGSCSSSTTIAIAGNNTITLNTLSDGTYSNCTITVTDNSGD